MAAFYLHFFPSISFSHSLSPQRASPVSWGPKGRRKAFYTRPVRLFPEWRRSRPAAGRPPASREVSLPWPASRHSPSSPRRFLMRLHNSSHVTRALAEMFVELKWNRSPAEAAWPLKPGRGTLYACINVSSNPFSPILKDEFEQILITWRKCCVRFWWTWPFQSRSRPAEKCLNSLLIFTKLLKKTRKLDPCNNLRWEMGIFFYLFIRTLILWGNQWNLKAFFSLQRHENTEISYCTMSWNGQVTSLTHLIISSFHCASGSRADRSQFINIYFLCS